MRMLGLDLSTWQPHAAKRAQKARHIGPLGQDVVKVELGRNEAVGSDRATARAHILTDAEDRTLRVDERRVDANGIDGVRGVVLKAIADDAATATVAIRGGVVAAASLVNAAVVQRLRGVRHLVGGHVFRVELFVVFTRVALQVLGDGLLVDECVVPFYFY